MTRQWTTTKWRQLSDGTVVNMPAPDEPHQCTVRLSDGTSRTFCFATRRGIMATAVDVDGRRYARLPERSWDDLED